MINRLKFLLTSFLMLFLVGCQFGGTKESEVVERLESKKNLENNLPSETVFELVGQDADMILDLLYVGDIETLDSRYIDPEKGLRLEKKDFLQAAARPFPLSKLYERNTEFEWRTLGEVGGTEILGFKDYLESVIRPTLYTQGQEYIEVDFRNTKKKSFNSRLRATNDYFNLQEFYPKAIYVEYYVEGDYNPEMNFQILRLAFEQNQDGIWKLVALFNSTWAM